MTYLSDALRRAAAGEDVTDLPDLLVAAAHALDRLTTDLARATGQTETVVRVAEGLSARPGAVSGGLRGQITPMGDDR